MRHKIAFLIILLSIFSFSVSDFVFAQETIPSCPIPRPTLSRSSQGDCVRFLQVRLNTLINAGLAEDGIFGSNTETAVRNYQQRNNLRVDGIVDTNTWNAIQRGQAGQQTQQQQQPPGYQIPSLPAGQGLTEDYIQGLLVRIANFLIAAGVILAIITIVISGIMYFRAGSDTEAKNAKGWFRNGIIGAFIILAVGVIILTIYNIVVNRSFFGGGLPPPAAGPARVPGGGPGAPPAEQGGSIPTGSGTRDIGDRCVVGGSECKDYLVCSSSTSVCRRVNGNLRGESCEDTTDCLAGLTCGRSADTLFFGKRCQASSAVSGQCRLTRILTDKTSVAVGDSIRITVVAVDAENCGGDSIDLSVCQNNSCSTIESGTFGTSTFTKLWTVTGISQAIFNFKASIGSSTVISPQIRKN